jgi:two-component system response regulator YesN
MPKTILIADDDPMITQIIGFGMEQSSKDVAVRSTMTGEATIAALQETTPDVLVLDIRMPRGDGFTVLEHLQKTKSTVPVVILTNYKTAEYMEKSQSYGVKEYLVKHELKLDRIVERVGSYLD